jgi:hypothetical protein
MMSAQQIVKFAFCCPIRIAKQAGILSSNHLRRGPIMKATVPSVALLLLLYLSFISCAQTSNSPFTEKHWSQLKHGGIKAFEKEGRGVAETLVFRGNEGPGNPSLIDLDGLLEHPDGYDTSGIFFIKGQIDLAARTFQYCLFFYPRVGEGKAVRAKGDLTCDNRLEGLSQDPDHPGIRYAFSYTEKAVNDKDQLSLRIDEVRKIVAGSLQAACDKASAAPAASQPTPPTGLRSQADVKINAYILGAD